MAKNKSPYRQALYKLDANKELKWSRRYNYDTGDLFAKSIYFDLGFLRNNFGEIPETIVVTVEVE